MQFDYDYLCQGLGHLTGLEVRVYHAGKRTFHYSHFYFEPEIDIAEMALSEIEAATDNVFYIETEDLLMFGVIKCHKTQHYIIIGPTSQTKPDKQGQMSILLQLKQTYTRLTELENYFRSMISYPFETFLEILCFVNYALNEEKLSVADLVKRNDITEKIMPNSPKINSELYSNPHNTYRTEKIMLSYIKSGNVEALENFFKEPPTGRIGSIAHNALRQQKNTFVCAATLISRAAIEGGMEAETAFALSDRFIQKAEIMQSGSDITLLNMEMLMEYTKRVEVLKCGTGESKLSRDVRRYIIRNISDKLSAEGIAAALGMNRTYLCDKFKQDTGMTIGDFILECKIDEAKRLLAVSSLSIAQISEYLAFSTQSYFQNVFKKIEGCTPKSYRENVQFELE